MSQADPGLRSSESGDPNKLAAADRAAHDWYRFVLSFPPHLVRAYLERFGLGPRQRVLDPFCGTGTTLVECKKLGIPSVGVEANPLAHFASRVKLDWSPDPQRLVRHAADLARAVEARLEGLGKKAELRTIPPEQRKLLLADSI